MIRYISRQAQLHPISAILYVLYLVFWLGMCYFTYYGLTSGNEDMLTTVLFYVFWFGCVPYLGINLMLAWYLKPRGAFYKEMAMLVFIPMGIVILIFVEHTVIAYFNKGI